MKESVRHINIKKILFGSIICLLFLPLVKKEIKFIKLTPLNGAIETVEIPCFELDNWLEGVYQKDLQRYLDHNIGFRNMFVRIYNQIYYSLFNQARANGVIVGKENYLYEENYIKAHLGTDFIGEEQIIEKVDKLQKVTDTLRTKGIDLIVVFAPGKGSFYPEFIPEEYDLALKSTTNYEVYHNQLMKSNIPFLDLNQWFRNMKSSSDYPLFPKTGIHWSKYGEVLALDTIANYIESIRNIKLPNIYIDKVEMSNTARASDDDIEKGMNLLFNIKDLKMGYPTLRFEDTSFITKPKVITVADSYYWGMFGSRLTSRLFEEDQFWYYNKEIHSNLLSSPLKVKDVNIKDEIEKRDIIMLLSTDANLYKFSYGFIEELYDAYFNGGANKIDSDNHYKERVQFYILLIKKSPEWLETIIKQAKREEISLDDALRKNAEYMVWKEGNES